MSEWQLIETAPKDGSLVMLYLPDSAVRPITFARWSSEAHYDRFGNRFPSNGDWYEDLGDQGWPIDVDATHWMPLPEPPLQA